MDSKKKLDERKNLNYLSDDIVNGKKSRNLNRMWCNIYGDPKSVLKKDKEGGELLGHVEQFALEIEKLLFPDLYWGRFMLHCCEIIRKGDVKKSPRCKGNVERSLRCNKINLLARFAGLNTTQHFHRDFEGLGLEAILVLRCNKSYSFAYFKGSHELSFNGGIEKETNVMKKDLVHLEVPVNHYIFFSPSLVHGGGPSSMVSDSNENYRKSKLSDLSISFDFSHLGCSKGASPGNGSTIAWKFEPGDPTSNTNLFEPNSKPPCFSKAMADATTNFLTTLDSKSDGSYPRMYSKHQQVNRN